MSDVEDSQRDNRDNPRDWIVFGLVGACLALAGVSLVLGMMVWRKYTPQIRTVEKRVEVPVEKIVKFVPTEKVEPTEASLVAYLEMMSPPFKLKFDQVSPGGYRMFAVNESPIVIGIKERADGEIESVVLDGVAKDFDPTETVASEVEWRLFRLHEMLVTIGYVIDPALISYAPKTREMFEANITKATTTTGARGKDFDVFVFRQEDAIEINISRLK